MRTQGTIDNAQRARGRSPVNAAGPEEGGSTMTRSNVKVGGTYLCGFGKNLVEVKVTEALPDDGGWKAVTTQTGKEVTARSAARLRKPTGETAEEQERAAKADKAAKPSKRTRRDGRMSLLDAAAEVLKGADAPMNAKTIVAQILEKGLWDTEGKTPHATLYSAMLREIQKRGDQARFEKVERGKFALAANHHSE